MPKIVHFELPFDDAERANKFYADVFGWQSSKWDGAGGVLPAADG